MERFTIKRFLGIFVKTDNVNYHAGNISLFTPKGPTVYHYAKEAPSDQWAIRRCWYFYLFAIVHISEGLSTSLPGWHLVLARIGWKKEYQGFSIRWAWADRYGSIKQPLGKRPGLFYHG